MSTGETRTKNNSENNQKIEITRPAWIYILRCIDNTLYCGSTTNLDRRVREHNKGSRGARYTSGRRPVELVYSELFINLSAACVREYEIKKMCREEKIKLIRI